MTNSLWPSFANQTVPRGMIQMLNDAAGDINAQTAGKIVFFVDTVGIGASGAVERIRYNCYLRVVESNYAHLLFQVITPVAGPFPATVVTPEGDKYAGLSDENELRHALEQVLQRERTKEVVLYLLNSIP